MKTLILIAEDSLTQALRLRNTLEKNGFDVTHARDGCEALATLATVHPALIVSDVQMPKMDGYELCRRVKGDDALRRIPVMLLTSLSAPEDIIQGLECGAENFVVKPYEEEFLLARIHAVLASRELEAQSADGSGIPVVFAGRRYVITSHRRQILNLLLSTYETAVQTNRDLIKAHHELKAAQAQLIEAEKLQSVGRLAAGVAHEVRNPLAIIEMGTDFLDAEPLSENGRTILRELKEAVSRANTVITRLMEFSLPRELGMQQLDVNDVVLRSLAALQAELVRTNIEVTTDFARGLPLSHIDAGKIDQALMNVFHNAVDAMPEGGKLTVRTFLRVLGEDDVGFEAGDRSGTRFRKGEEVITLEVRDTGGGIVVESLGKVFEPFFSTKPTGRGMGLGLTVAKKMIELHRGRIDLGNHPGGGAVITILFRIP